MKAAISYDGIHRVESFPVPYEAIREAVLNALVHRDYAVTAPIQIRVYEDRLKIWNPAVLPDGWNLEKLLDTHASRPYNPSVANVFFRSGEIESWGRGIERMFSVCRKSGYPHPIIQLDGYDLWVEFPFPQEYLNTIKGEASIKKRTTQKTTQKILAILRENPKMSRAQIAEQLEDITEDGVKYHLSKMKQAGLITRIGPDKGGYWKVHE